jgi:hypothetical protein
MLPPFLQFNEKWLPKIDLAPPTIPPKTAWKGQREEVPPTTAPKSQRVEEAEFPTTAPKSQRDGQALEEPTLKDWAPAPFDVKVRKTYPYPLKLSLAKKGADEKKFSGQVPSTVTGQFKGPVFQAGDTPDVSPEIASTDTLGAQLRGMEKTFSNICEQVSEPPLPSERPPPQTKEELLEDLRERHAFCP